MNNRPEGLLILKSGYAETLLLVFVLWLMAWQPAFAATPDKQYQAYIAQWAIYDPDPNHLWNQIFRSLYEIKDNNKGFCYDETFFVLQNNLACKFDRKTQAEIAGKLDKFLKADAETLITSPLKKAVFQHDLWRVFEWTLTHPNAFEKGGVKPLQKKLLRVMRRVALSRAEINRLPDNYQLTHQAKTYPARYSPSQRSPFFPDSFWGGKGDWVLLDDAVNFNDTPATIHRHRFSGRSSFFVLINLPGGREKTLALIKELREFGGNPLRFFNALKKQPDFDRRLLPLGTQVALVRTMTVLSKSGWVYSTPIMENLQLRVYRDPKLADLYPRSENVKASTAFKSFPQDVYIFRMNRRLLFDNAARSLTPVHGSDLHGQHTIKSLSGNTGKPEDISDLHVVESCELCHGGNRLTSFQTFGRPAMTGERIPFLGESSRDHIEYRFLQWKKQDASWGYLRALWQHLPEDKGETQ